jgi:hypothetical protein
MNKKTKMLLGVAALGGAAILLLNKKKNFANAVGKNCKTVNGNISTAWIGRDIDGWVVTSTGNGTTTLCKKQSGLVSKIAQVLKLGKKCTTINENIDNIWIGRCIGGKEVISTGNGSTTLCITDKCLRQN